MNKLTTILMSILLLGIIVPVVAPTAFVAVPSHATTNNTIILQGYTVKSTYPYYSITTASINISVDSASSSVVKIDTTSAPSNTLLDINLSGITISSGSITLYSSTNAQSSIGSSDVAYATLPTSYITLTHHATTKGPLEDFYNYTSNGVTYSLGNDSIIGPSPNNIGGGAYYIKGFFGSSAPVATSTAQLIILPNISISPTSGGAGTPITVTGTGFTSSSSANVTYSYKYDGASKLTTVTKTGIATNSTGGFIYTFNAPEMALNDTGTPLHTGSVSIVGNDTTTLKATGTQTFTENARELITFAPTSTSGTSKNLVVSSDNYNDTTSNILAPVYIKEPVNIIGNYFDPSSTLTFTYNGISLGTATTNSTGYFNATFTIPIVAGGRYYLNITDPLATIGLYTATTETLVVTPTNVQPTGSIAINGYGFPSSDSVSVIWVHVVNNPAKTASIQSISNTSISSNGEFSASFTIPLLTPGGTASVGANLTGTSFAYTNTYTFTNITIVPMMEITPSTGAVGTTVNATGYGLNAGTGTSSFNSGKTVLSLGHVAGDYLVAYDNVPVFGSSVGATPSYNGTLSVLLSAVGTPMIHEVQLVNATTTPYVLVASAPLNVTGSINGVTSQVSGVSAALASIESSLMSITTSLTSLSSAVSSISAGITNIESTLSSITSSLSSISGTLTSMSSTLTSIQTSVSGLNTSSLASTLSSVMTYLLVVAVLAIIIIVLEIVLLVRKK